MLEIHKMGSRKLLKFLSLWAGSTIFTLVASYLISSQIILGNSSITKPVSSLILGLATTCVFFLAAPVAKRLDLKIKDERVWVAVFFVVNSVVIWILKRFSTLSGVGISNIIFVLLVAVLATCSEYFIDKYIDKIFKKG